MTEQMLQILTQAGPVGVVLIVCMYALRAKDAKLDEVQEKRVADGQMYAQKLLELVAQERAATATMASAIDHNADTTRELRMLVEQLLREQERTAARPVMPPRKGG